jgi:DNA-binding winged helix-turn-helix (wHTH) protein
MVNWNNMFQFDLQPLRLTNLDTGRECALTRNEALLLQALIDGISTKQDLIHEVWTRHHAVVTENSYYQLVSLLRKSFGSIDLPGVIVTLPRKGLALAHPAPRGSDAPMVVVSACAAGAELEVDYVRRPAADPAGTHSGSSGNRDPGAGPAEMPWWRRLGHNWRIPVSTLACTTLIILSWVSIHRPAKAPGSRASRADVPTLSDSRPQASIVVGDTTIRYAGIPADTARRVWRDVQARADIAPELTRHIRIAQHQNRYAVLACSAPLDSQNIRCQTVTVPL